ncbi:MAG TPA: hypothetical protein VMZ91_14070 [Candidatus Paceibacterota bacterium]|nr:hypothetical protein [Candidatus Paceibacterota bacterium]
MPDNKIKAEDLIKEIIGGIKSVDTSQIEIKQKSVKNKNKKDRKIINIKKKKVDKNQLEIIDMEKADEVEWGKKNKERKMEIREDLNEWKKIDFVLFTKKLYFKKFKKEWSLRIPAACVEIGRIRDELADIFGATTNLLLKDYIFYFFQNCVNYYIKEKGDFYFGQMREKNPIEQFYEHYNREDSGKELNKKQEDKQLVLSNELINNSYIISVKNLVFNYGIIIAVNWLIFKKDMDISFATEKIYNCCISLKKRKFFEIVKKSTKKWSPYPKWFAFKDIDSFMKKITGKLLSIEIEFSNSDIINKNFTFMKKGEK